MRDFRILTFLRFNYADTLCKFPTCPEDTAHEETVLVCSDYAASSNNFHTRIFDYRHLVENTRIMNIVCALLNEPNTERKNIYSVHPNSVILPINRWALMQNLGHEPEGLNFLHSRVKDICELFHKPSILSLERRNNFDCSVIQRWFNFSIDPKVTSCVDRSISVLQNICLRL
jgi:hypothetical protein